MGSLEAWNTEEWRRDPSGQKDGSLSCPHFPYYQKKNRSSEAG
ncbi:hypothetical protein MtrunA17_Chr4g0024821 [Medicago truncatula]|uniref:Uncharacterized protein n=1 Tax=Medicago truncatula TaxID=3880 RepID=A0A396I3Z2_MEDTR|nr:hypothetical protein MtrunA17_Chr4g0024821 [Medicago truncatula]